MIGIISATSVSQTIKNMKYILAALFFMHTLVSSAQRRETFDLATYTIPAGWKKTTQTANVISYVATNNQAGTYVQVGIYASTASKGGLKADFESEWQELIVKTYHPSDMPQLTPAETRNGWQAQAGAAPFEFNGAQSAAMLVTASGFSRCLSIAVLTNTNAYEQEIQSFLESVELAQPQANAQTTNSKNEGSPVGGKLPATNPTTKTQGNGQFRFTTTNFDDGWIGTAEEDWVRVTKGNIHVLLHFNNDKVDLSSADHATISNNAWNTLVAPRYSSLSNYHVMGVTLNYDRPYLISGEVTDNESGKRRFVSLFRKTKNVWVEIICPDRQTFINTFGVDAPKVDYYADDSMWIGLTKLYGYNKFAVDAADLNGTWTSDFSGMTQYVNAYTGASAGMDTYSSNEKFEFGPGNTYKWNIGAASGFVGNLKYQSAKSSGTFSVPNNWQVSFSDIEGKPKTYDASFSCLKGARILWFGNTGYGKVN
jgi:hypothetical protein